MKHWKTILTLILMAFALYFQWNWFWAILILLGLANVFATNEIHFVETIKRKESPILYWIVVAVWVFFTIIALLPYIDFE